MPRNRLLQSSAGANRLAPALLVVAALVSCSPGGDSSGPLPRDESAEVQLDYENVKITLPTTEYRVSRELNQKLVVVTELMIKPCLAEHGYDLPIPSLESNSEDRNWGLWNVERAQQYGYQFVPMDVPPEPTGDEYSKARQGCWDGAARERGDLFDDAPQDFNSMASDITGRASFAAKETDEYLALREEVEACLNAEGFQIDSDSFGIALGEVEVASGGTPTQGEIDAAVAEASCNQEHNVTQRMGDLEASFAAPMVEENQAALNKEKELIAALEVRVDEYLREHQ